MADHFSKQRLFQRYFLAWEGFSEFSEGFPKFARTSLSVCYKEIKQKLDLLTHCLIQKGCDPNVSPAFWNHRLVSHLVNFVLLDLCNIQSCVKEMYEIFEYVIIFKSIINIRNFFLSVLWSRLHAKVKFEKSNFYAQSTDKIKNSDLKYLNWWTVSLVVPYEKSEIWPNFLV